MISLTLPFPPSVNTAYRNPTARDGKKRGRIKTKRYYAWAKNAGQAVLMQPRQQPIKGSIRWAFLFGRPDKTHAQSVADEARRVHAARRDPRVRIHVDARPHGLAA